MMWLSEMTRGDEKAVPMFERTETPVEFEPPDKILPGQLGTLIDEAANPLDVTATIVDLAVRNHLRIEEIPKEGLFGKPDWKFVKLADGKGKLKPYEQELYEGIFEEGDQVPLSDLKNNFAAKLHLVQGKLYDDAVA